MRAGCPLLAQADMRIALSDVRFWGQSEHGADRMHMSGPPTAIKDRAGRQGGPESSTEALEDPMCTGRAS
jgi:hypothetical protein